MKLEEAIRVCHAHSAIYRASKPQNKYWKNHQKSFGERIPEEDKIALDWVGHNQEEGINDGRTDWD